MIEGNGTALAETAFEDAIEATVYMATVHVREGELTLPPRIREHLADGPVIVHLVRGENDVAVHETTLTSRSTLTGIAWPEEVKPRTTLTVLCPRGAAGHDIAVLLPELDGDWSAEPEPVAEPESDTAVTGRKLGDPTAAEWRAALAAADAEREAAAETEQPGPAEYDVPTVHGHPAAWTAEEAFTGELPAWPGDEDSEERTDLLPVAVAPDLVEDDDPRTVFSAALVAVRSNALVAVQEPPRPVGWLERRVREAARLVLDRSWTATRILVATASGLVLTGAGLAYLVLAVTR